LSPTAPAARQRAKKCGRLGLRPRWRMKPGRIGARARETAKTGVVAWPYCKSPIGVGASGSFRRGPPGRAGLIWGGVPRVSSADGGLHPGLLSIAPPGQGSRIGKIVAPHRDERCSSSS
jgi:hypothetical protein